MNGISSHRISPNSLTFTFLCVNLKISSKQLAASPSIDLPYFNACNSDGTCDVPAIFANNGSGSIFSLDNLYNFASCVFTKCPFEAVMTCLLYENQSGFSLCPNVCDLHDLTIFCLEVTFGQADFGNAETNMQSVSSQIGLIAVAISSRHSLKLHSLKGSYCFFGDGFRSLLAFPFSQSHSWTISCP